MSDHIISDCVVYFASELVLSFYHIDIIIRWWLGGGLMPRPLKRSELAPLCADEARVNHAVRASEAASIPTGALLTLSSKYCMNYTCWVSCTELTAR